MKIHALCIVKNESDVVSQTLIAATKWCDFIYCFDNGSTDGTWEEIIGLSGKYSQIIPYKQEDCPFKDSLRSEIFNRYRTNSTEGDWWCRLDADEIYIDNPRQFINKVPPKYNVIVTATFHYYFTDKDLDLHNSDPSLYGDDIPVEQKCRYYINNWSEIRFFRYMSDLVWHEDNEWPSGLIGDAYPIRIKLKNFQYRSPEQIQKRIDTRREAALRGLFPHEAQKDWKQSLFVVSKHFQSVDLDFNQVWTNRIAEASELYFDNLDEKYVVRNDLMPNIYTMSLIWDYRVTPINLLKRLVKKVGEFKISSGKDS